MLLSDAKAATLELLQTDLGPAYRQYVDPAGTAKDPAKFTLGGRPARVVGPFSGYFPNVNRAWFEGQAGLPAIQGEPFELYVFFIKAKGSGRGKKRVEGPPSYFIATVEQLRGWVMEFLATHGDSHANHVDWRCDIHLQETRSAIFRWGDEDPALDGLPESRRIRLRNVSDILALGGPTPGPDVMADDQLEDLVEDAARNDPARWQQVARRIRQGQPMFRKELLYSYAQACAVSGHGPEEVLEAAHIRPHAVSGLNASTNGLLLRADLHTLFDDELLRIHPDTLTVWIHPTLAGTPYWELNGRPLRQRTDGKSPNREALRERWAPDAPTSPGARSEQPGART